MQGSYKLMISENKYFFCMYHKTLKSVELLTVVDLLMTNQKIFDTKFYFNMFS